MQKIGEAYANTETWYRWIVYDPPLGGSILMDGFMDSDIGESVELDEDSNIMCHFYTNLEGLIYRDGAWHSPRE